MKIVIRNLTSQEYLDAAGNWTKDFIHAHHFQRTTDTDIVIKQKKLNGVEVLMKSGISGHEIRVAKY